jgi:hypothetical protein
MTTHVIRLTEMPGRLGYSWGDTAGRTYKSGSLDGTGVVFRVPSQYNRGATFSLTYMDADSVGRDETAGPLHQGARAWLNAEATVIAAWPIPRDKVINAEIGDLIVVPALDLVLRVTPGTRWSDPSVEVVAAPPATEDYSELIETENAKPRQYPSEAWLSG